MSQISVTRDSRFQVLFPSCFHTNTDQRVRTRDKLLIAPLYQKVGRNWAKEPRNRFQGRDSASLCSLCWSFRTICGGQRQNLEIFKEPRNRLRQPMMQNESEDACFFCCRLIQLPLPPPRSPTAAAMASLWFPSSLSHNILLSV
jgi:hypothetical protein